MFLKIILNTLYKFYINFRDKICILAYIRASPAPVYIALYLHMWRAKIKNLCSSTCLSDHSKTQSATVAYTLYNLFSRIKNHFWPTYLSFFFFLARFFSLSSFPFPSLLSSLSSFPFLLSPLFPFVVVGLGFAQRGLGFARRSQPGCDGLHRSQCGGGAVGVIVGLPIFKS